MDLYHWVKVIIKKSNFLFLTKVKLRKSFAYPRAIVNFPTFDDYFSFPLSIYFNNVIFILGILEVNNQLFPNGLKIDSTWMKCTILGSLLFHCWKVNCWEILHFLADSNIFLVSAVPCLTHWLFKLSPFSLSHHHIWLTMFSTLF